MPSMVVTKPIQLRSCGPSMSDPPGLADPSGKILG
jgi:hypothetical protein